LASNLSAENHQLSVLRRTEGQFGISTFIGILLDDAGILVKSNNTLKRKIQFIGDSITCSYGILGKEPCSDIRGNEDDYLSYGPQIARALNAEVQISCYQGKGIIHNYDSPNVYSSDPFPLYWNRSFSIDKNPVWDFSEWIPDAVVINLGTNDYSSPPHPTFQEFSFAYKQFISRIMTDYSPNVTFFLVCGPMSKVECPTIQEVAESFASGVYFIYIPFLKGSEIGCYSHPSVSGAQVMKDACLPIIQKAMNW